MMDHWSRSSHGNGVMPRDAECDVCDVYDVLCTGDMTLPWETGTIASDQNIETSSQTLTSNYNHKIHGWYVLRAFSLLNVIHE